ncbi:MAG: hypothetical protein ACREIF_02275 [Chthoniobacterales bacterium]
MQRISKTTRRWLPAIILPFACTVLAGSVRADDSKSIKGFRDAIVALAPDVDPAEAQLVSETAHQTARRLAKEWRVVPPADFQNFLIHIGARQYGYCFHWARGIGEQLRMLHLKTLVLYWAAADPGTNLEHNCIVVTARGQPMSDGYIIDGWRQCGRLTWWPVKKDTYPWKELPKETAWVRNEVTPVSRKSRRVPVRPQAAASLDRSHAPPSAD